MVPKNSCGSTENAAALRVWDPFVRIFHWALAIGFFVAFFTEDEALTIHVWAGYCVGILVLLRILWGFVGTEYARFGDFVYRPAAAAVYVRDLLLFRAKRYLGHSPGGGLMVVVLLVSLLLTVGTGLATYGAENKAGPLAPLFTGATIPGQSDQAAILVNDDDDDGEKDRDDDDFWEEFHEALANLSLALVIVHILGVLVASVVHKENLLKSMVTGSKRALRH